MALESPQSYEALCEAARKLVKVATCEEFVAAGNQPNTLLIDVREPEEWEDGIIGGALLMPRGVLERDVRKQVEDLDRSMLIYCRSGKRSLLAAATLRSMGYRNVISLEGGFDAWRNAEMTVTPGPCGNFSMTGNSDEWDPEDWTSIRASFAITARTVECLTGEERPLVYLDHAATTHPPNQVLDRLSQFLRFEYANVHRATYHLARRSTLRFEDAYRTCSAFVGADPDHHCVIFTANTTAGCELVAHALAERPGKVLVTNLEHHSNDLPHRRRSEVIRIGLDPSGRLDMEQLRGVLKSESIKLVNITGAANVTGWMPPLREIATLAHAAGALVCLDAAQLLAHAPIDMGAPGEPGSIDFLVAAGHKAYAPFGAGFVVGPREVFDAVEPVVAGGGVAASVDETHATWLNSPDRHQFGTPNVGGAIALAEMLNLLQVIGMDRVRAHEMALLQRMTEGLKGIGGIELYGPPELDQRVGIVPFNVQDVSDMMTAAVLGEEYGIAVRNGRFCSHVHTRHLLGPNGQSDGGAVRASIGLYNNEDDIDRFLEAVEVVRRGGWQGEYLEQGGQLSAQWGGRCADRWMEAAPPSPDGQSD
ncbi:MAG: aminotransferase class V-fold PLP-dependent enzyme [Phycisphaerales bacterium]|nr:aminotransferase class V-fold PLP-dependent enzyme [Phycisphaerales bacterium]